jgi:D-galactarolactone isomerase
MNDSGQPAPRLKAPPGTWDTHMHVYEPGYAIAPTAVSKPHDAPTSEYLKVRKNLGIAHTVVVQPSAYGKDNSCTLAAMRMMGPDSRGIAVCDESATDAELKRLHEGGIRGLRFFYFPGGFLTWESLARLTPRVQSLGWHVIVQFDGREFPEREASLKRLPGTVIIDHVGKFIEPVTPDHAAFTAFLRVVETGRFYVKLSAPYEVSRVGPPNYDDVGALAKALVKAAPERMLWASNWPYVATPPERMPKDAWMLDMLLDWVPDAPTRHRILVENPARLYTA